ncbi:hypothetical protein [Agromyces cerinus]|uniref:Uncharacterized protein n=1 Tax=Agromyces cerinus subsp. cerinus TaxID=232089 RepID=A0A1N6ERY6_9MICO|nr:hypothetical protein [Agromyces cerinus]SIN85750.1 hypothetical protein SAMN05443544_1404 [Agromyces cerinus subsp. cerinus]
MTAVATAPVVRTEARSRAHEIWRIVRLHAVNPSIFFGIPWMIIGAAWAISLIITLIIRAGSGGDVTTEDLDNMRYSWAVLSPQWYLVVVGVQAIGFTFSFALGFGTTRRDFWVGTSVMFLLVSIMYAAAIATLVQIEIATDGWGLGAHMFDALWYGQNWFLDFYTSFALQLLVLFIGASVTTVYMRWRMRGMMILLFTAIALLLAAITGVTLTGSWPSLFAWFGTIGIAGVFSVVLGLAVVSAIVGYFVIRRATPR